MNNKTIIEFPYVTSQILNAVTVWLELELIK